MMTLQKKYKLGFTLLELLVVMAIIGVLASIAMPSYIQYLQEAYAVSCLSNRKNMEAGAVIERDADIKGDLSGLLLDKITAYQCPLEGVYTWHSTDPEHEFFGHVLCSIHLNGENTAVKFEVPTGVDIAPNGSFEGLERVPRPRGWRPIPSRYVDAWDSDTDIEVWAKGMFGITPPNGDYFIELDSGRGKGGDSISQEIQTEPGRVYEVKVTARARTRRGTDDFEISWGDNEPEQFTPAHGVWNDYTTKVVGTGGPLKLAISEVAGQDDGLGALLDSIQVITTDEVR